MSATLNDERTTFAKPRFRYLREATHRSLERASHRRHPVDEVTVEEERAMVAKGAIVLAVLCALPLTLVIIWHYFQNWF